MPDNQTTMKDWGKIADQNHDEPQNAATESSEELKQESANVSEETGVDKNYELILQEKNQEIEKLKKEYLLVLADRKNIENRHQTELDKAYKYSVEKLLNSLLPIMDSLEMSLSKMQTDVQSNESAAKSVIEGIELTLKMFTDTLQKFGVEQVNPKGELFNPNLHEAMSMKENADVPHNHIIDVLQKGYLLNGRVVRAALVTICKNS